MCYNKEAVWICTITCGLDQTTLPLRFIEMPSMVIRCGCAMHDETYYLAYKNFWAQRHPSTETCCTEYFRAFPMQTCVFDACRCQSDGHIPCSPPPHPPSPQKKKASRLTPQLEWLKPPPILQVVVWASDIPSWAWTWGRVGFLGACRGFGVQATVFDSGTSAPPSRRQWEWRSVQEDFRNYLSEASLLLCWRAAQQNMCRGGERKQFIWSPTSRSTISLRLQPPWIRCLEVSLFLDDTGNSGATQRLSPSEGPK